MSSQTEFHPGLASQLVPTVVAACLSAGLVANASANDPFVEGARPRQLLTEGAGEGPAWHPDLGLLFSGNGHTMRYDRDGHLRIFRKNAGSNGLLFDREGRLLTCESRAGRVTRLEIGGPLTVLAERFDGHRFNTPNDITLDSRGRIYFSDPRYGDRSDIEMVDAAGEVVEGVYRIDPDGTVSRIIAHEVDRPNGVLVTEGDRYLYVAGNTNDRHGGDRKLWRFALRDDGTVVLASQRMIYDWGESRGPDGMAVDRAGRLYVAGGRNRATEFETAAKKGGVYVFDAAGEFLTFVPIEHDEVTNCAFGGDDLRTLFITAGGTLWSLRTRVPGQVAWPRTQ